MPLWITPVNYLTTATFPFELTDVCKPDHSTCSSLMSFLEHFNQNRHHVTNPEGKQIARDFIKNTFQDFGLSMWSEGFKPDPLFPQVKFTPEIGRRLYDTGLAFFNCSTHLRTINNNNVHTFIHSFVRSFVRSFARSFFHS